MSRPRAWRERRERKAAPEVGRAAMLEAWRPGDPVCRAQMDGDCDWVDCPQATHYQTTCPLPHWTEDPEY